MPSPYTTPEKVSMKNQLFRIAKEALETDGWKIERVPGSGKSSVRRISKEGESKIITIRTSQDTRIAFSRTDDDKSWRTLNDVDAVVAVSVDDKLDPKSAKVHLFDGDDIRGRFDRAYEARKKAGHKILIGRGVWLSLYILEANEPVSLVGAGAGLEFPEIQTVELPSSQALTAGLSESDTEGEIGFGDRSSEGTGLSISEAKLRLAETFGIEPSNIKITIEV